MNEKDFSDLGREIGEKIEKFANSKEVRELQENIRMTVESTMQGVSRSVKEAADNVNKSMEANRKASSSNGTSKTVGQEPYRYEKQAKTKPPVKKYEKKRQLPVKKSPEGSVSGILLGVFGTMGAIIFFAYSLVAYSLSFFAAQVLGTMLLPVEVPLAIACVCTAAAGVGGFLRSRVKRFRKYVKAMGEKDFHSIKSLSEIVQKKEKFVLKDLKKMIRRKWFYEGHLDEQGTCFMLTEDSYHMYKEAQKELELRQEEAKRLEMEKELLEQDPVKKQLKITIEEGKEYIRRIKKANDKLPEEAISSKLDRLEQVCVRIFEHIEENPEKLPDIRRFMSYYMPTTLKLVETYQEFSEQPVQGENITVAKNEIEKMLDDINIAFEKMFDKLFEDDAMDISTDISVLSAMLAQEGLLKDEFTIKNKAE
ncbi:5-bromo-4-chloroindolyl phosphate hydrolysis family protein [Kineothrix sp. MB12-C1]|uniref:5-bromo-4-chloroindolyl phosphate hydrolysis family protein n=1 Tax=Kineothrix sp. MB12-C1 TaxID=3070215 RepID=UPI0027D2C02F|nr:5-bromo-4-chloroindolyl phosphate hydrolysis family protein [Kineothrix sp. MB12-C1]WMC94093.1 5-bromo-4-chloroindolyl phosphate hydrolysis family protein [Kineothrix sp. MB12-C1]